MEYIVKSEKDMDGVDSYVQVGKLIRCKDCKYHFRKDGLAYCSIRICVYGFRDDDFCSMAKQKEVDNG